MTLLKLKQRDRLKALAKYFILWILLIPMVLVGQDDATQLFEPSLIKADIDTLISKLIDVHPTFYDHYNANNMQVQVEGIKSKINKPISSLDLFRLMQPIVSIDGHTTLRHTGGLCPGVENPLFPFRVIIHEESLYIKENLTANEGLYRGTIIENINGIPVELIIDNLRRYVPGEKQSHKTKSLESQFHIYLALVYGSFAEFNITVNNAVLNLKGATWDDYQTLSKPKFELRFYDDDIAYIYKRMFMPPRDFMHFMDSAFMAISEKQINYLIIDNLQGGGLTDLADSLISYFTIEPYCLMEKKMTKLSLLTKEFVEAKKMKGYIKNGYFIEEYPTHPSVRENQFSGLTYILIGPLSYSTATCFPAAAKYYDNAIIVGEESGQPLISNGDQNSFVLPNTKTTCVTALSTVYMPGHDNDHIKGVFPDYEVKPTLDDLLYDKEYQLDFTLELIRKEKLK